AEVHALVHVPSGVDVLFHAPWGLAPPGAPPREGADGHPFLERYAGGWQELFPSANDANSVDGREIPFHGEVANRAWQATVLVDEADAAAVAFVVDCETVPLRLERTMRLDPGSATLVLDEVVTALGSAPARCTWGHHLVLGPPFVE